MNKLKLLIGVLAGTVTIGSCTLGVMYNIGFKLPWSNNAEAPTTYIRWEDNAIAEMNNTNIKLVFSENDVITIPMKEYSKPSTMLVKPKFTKWLLGEGFRLTKIWGIDKASLTEYLNSLYVKPVSAKIYVDKNNKIMLQKEVDNRSFNVQDAYNQIVASCNAGTYEVPMSEVKVAAKRTEASLKKRYDSLVWLNDFFITYTDGTVFRGTDVTKNIQNNKLNIDDLSFDDFLSKLESSYNTSNKKIKFKTHSGKKIDITYNTYGLHVFRDKETEFIKEALKNQKSVKERTPCTYGYDDLEDTYIEVSKSEQHLWVYSKGKLKYESNVVTGRKGVHDTPSGVFYISECIPGKNLVGDNYTTWVNRWMRLTNSGVGLHDAYWRSNFGGKIYESNGSHGCINLPKDFAYKLYEDAYVGMPVIIY